MPGSFPKPSLTERLENGVPLLTDEALFDACGVRVAFFGREGGVSVAPYDSLNTGDHVGDDYVCVRRNRETVLQALGFSRASLVVPKQVHGTQIVQVKCEADISRAREEAEAGADAMMVSVPDVAALLNFADCLPLILVAPSGRFAVVHAGWRGALAGIAGKAAHLMAELEGGDAAGVNAYIGPYIHAECFETSEEVTSQFVDAYGSDVAEGERHVNLARVVSVGLERAGVLPDRIVDSGICTVCNADRYFSYRAENVCGRHAAIAVRQAR